MKRNSAAVVGGGGLSSVGADEVAARCLPVERLLRAWAALRQGTNLSWDECAICGPSCKLRLILRGAEKSARSAKPRCSMKPRVNSQKLPFRKTCHVERILLHTYYATRVIQIPGQGGEGLLRILKGMFWGAGGGGWRYENHRG